MRTRLFAGLLTIGLLASSGAGQAAAEWIVDPSRPGPDIPRSGKSRFDQLFQQADGSYAIPYPVDALIAYLDARLDNGRDPGVRRVLIPRGRSLQREAPAPDYFRFPRLVIATEGEPAGDLDEAGLVMEYRLFIAHQPMTESLEVISYNDAAGRFEFQVFEGYGATTAARARPTSRAMCLSCHHNGAPIFARNPWSETSFNVRVAQRLADEMPDRYRSMIDILTLDAGVIDVLAERANYLSAAQLLWRRACGTPACRSAMLRAVLQYRLSDKADFDRRSQRYRRHYVAELERSWQRYWPTGLALAGSRIPDRDPFVAQIEGDLDPLSPRPPQASWRAVDSALADGIIIRLGGFFTAGDIRQLDARLRELAAERGVSTRRYRAACQPAHREPGIVGLACGDSGGSGGMRARIELEHEAGRVTALGVVALQLPESANLLQPEPGRLVQTDSRLSATVGPQSNGLSARLYDGDRIARITLEWDASWSAAESRLEVEVVEDFRLLDAALDQIGARDAANDDNPFDRPVFARQPVMRALAGTLGLRQPRPDDGGKARARPPQRRIAELDGDLVLLKPYCAHCHADPSRHPPGFLSISASSDSLAGCAPRMLARLRAWQSDAIDRPVPMPPPMSIGLSGTSAADWPASDHFARLVSNLESLLARRLGDAAAARLSNTDYDRLPPCTVEFSE